MGNLERSKPTASVELLIELTERPGPPAHHFHQSDSGVGFGPSPSREGRNPR